MSGYSGIGRSRNCMQLADAIERLKGCHSKEMFIIGVTEG